MEVNNSKIPNRILVKRIEDYHTHYLGKTNDGKLFFGHETFTYKIPHWEVKEELQSQNRVDFAVLYLFDKNGKIIEHKYWSTDLDNERQNTSQKLEVMIANLGEITFCDIEVEIFDIYINEIKFGLIPNEEFHSIDLYPGSTISFQEPWNGEYYT